MHSPIWSAAPSGAALASKTIEVERAITVVRDRMPHVARRTSFRSWAVRVDDTASSEKAVPTAPHSKDRASSSLASLGKRFL
ncbi:MAG: hypothetical protein ACKO38_04090, partial [Planctomycetota bacterium]